MNDATARSIIALTTSKEFAPKTRSWDDLVERLSSHLGEALAAMPPADLTL